MMVPKVVAARRRSLFNKKGTLLTISPGAERRWVPRKTRCARHGRTPEPDVARTRLRDLAGPLERINPDAAGSLREGRAEMFRLSRLGPPGTLLATVTSSNPVESMIDINAQPRPQ